MKASRWVFALSSAPAVTAVSAQEPARPNPVPQPQPQAQPQPQPQPQPAQVEDQLRKDAKPGDKDKEQLAQPGPEHRNLNAFVGTWQVSGQCWKDGKQPESVSGTVNAEWVLGNRFVKSHVNGTEAGKTFEGIGMCGYDNAKKQYVSTWQDTSCTGIKMETGNYEPGTKTYTYTCESKDDAGKTVRCRSTVKIVSDNEHVMTAYKTESGQPEAKVAELTFKRTSRTADARNPS